MSNLTPQDLEILIDAVEAWESRDAVGQVMEGILDGMLSRGNPEVEKKLQEEGRIKKLAAEEKKKREKYVAISLKAKLISLKEQVEMDDAKKSVDSMMEMSRKLSKAS